MITGLQDTIKADSARSTKIDCTKSVEEYINKHDWRINANSNTGYSNAGMVNNIAGKVVANYWLDKVYSKKAGDAHRNGDIHIHDLDCLCPYCFTKDTYFKTVEYGTISIAEMLERRIQIFSVYSFNLETQKVCERQAYDLRCTRKNAKIVEVEFSNGYTVRCTPDHKFLAPVPVVDADSGKTYIEFDWRPISELYRMNVRSTLSAPDFFNQKRIDIEQIENELTIEEYEAICPRVVRITELEQTEDVYCMTVDDTHNFILETGIIAHNCCGHDLQRLLEEGFNGVPGRPASKAPKHFREALGQMANYLGILQAEWAGAQAFSSFDTFLAPYVFFDMYYNGAEFSDIKKAILQFIYNLNVPARWGQCVPVSYKCKKADGTWATVEELKIGDEICVFDIETGEIKTDTITHLNVYDDISDMHLYVSKTGTKTFFVTPNHRVIIKDGDKFIIEESADVLKRFKENGFIEIPVENGTELFGVLPCKRSTGEKVWCPTTNTGTFICMTDDGYVFFTGNSPFTNITVDWKVPADMRDQPPMRDGDHYFVSIFKDYAAKDKIDANKLHRMLRKLRQRLDISIDMNRILIDADNEYLYEILYQISYAIFEDEMVLIDKAFYECLNEGDLLGQPFVFPIPTINITEDFDWDDERANVLFENAAKYGSSYFQNFIGSQYITDENGNKVKDPKAYGPNDVRSMCPLSIDTQVVARRKEGNGWVIENIMLKDIKSGVHQVMYKDEWREFKPFEVEDKHTDGVNKYQYVDMDVCLVKFGDKEVKFGKFHIQPIIREGSEITHYKMAGAIRVGDKLPVYDFETETINPVEVTEVIKVEREPVMCITVDSPEHLFTLSNGLITHNCRLKLDLAELRKKGGGLFGADSQTGCYDDQTEVLTTNGWKLFKDVSFNDKFYTLTTDRKIEVHNPINIFQYDYDGDLCHFSTDSLDLMVTPNHRMLLTHNSNDKFRFKEAKDCDHACLIPVRGNWEGIDKEYFELEATEPARFNTKGCEAVKIKMETWLKFLGLFLSEGSVRGAKGGNSVNKSKYEVTITQRKAQNISIIDEVFEAMPYKYSRYTSTNGTVYWTICSKQLWLEMSKFGNSHTKYIPDYVFELSSRLINILLDYMIIGDGHIRKDNGHKEYYTSSERLKNDIQHLALLVGQGTSVFIGREKQCYLRGRKITATVPNYTVSFHIAKNRGVNGYVKTPYTGKVYCVEVPNNTVFVRRNGKTAWCGNSIGNITFNMARLGYLYKGNKKALYKKLDDLLEISKDCHEKKRKFVTEMNARGLYPYTRRYIRTFDTYFSTIGLNGMNEMVRNFTDDQYDITTEYGQNMCKEIMIYLRERLVEIQEETGNLYNLEASPGEGTTFRLAKSDLSKFGPKEITYIECEKHGRVEIKTNDDTEYAECPICRSESEG